MKRSFYTNFETIKDIIDNLDFGFDFDRKVKQVNILGFWDNVIPKHLSNFTKPISINDQNKLIVAVKNSVVASELGFMKKKLISKINVFSQPLNIEIEDIVFNHKIWARY